MKIDPSTLVFFDASCLIAAAGSPTGGSGFLLSLCAQEALRGVVSQVVLLESERNIRSKLGADALERYHTLLQRVPFVVAPVPRSSDQPARAQGINPKDMHVVLACLAVQAPFMLSLDRGLNLQVNQADLSLQALTPGEFIKHVLPHHKDFPRLR